MDPVVAGNRPAMLDPVFANGFGNAVRKGVAGRKTLAVIQRIHDACNGRWSIKAGSRSKAAASWPVSQRGKRVRDGFFPSSRKSDTGLEKLNRPGSGKISMAFSLGEELRLESGTGSNEWKYTKSARTRQETESLNEAANSLSGIGQNWTWSPASKPRGRIPEGIENCKRRPPDQLPPSGRLDGINSGLFPRKGDRPGGHLWSGGRRDGGFRFPWGQSPSPEGRGSLRWRTPGRGWRRATLRPRRRRFCDTEPHRPDPGRTSFP